ncbi:hypothetical protein BLOT_011134 [Blomia tropicalis]|nr:hypothetical protein BLOT_011134 [Blomia tropicalis]
MELGSPHMKSLCVPCFLASRTTNNNNHNNKSTRQIQSFELLVDSILQLTTKILILILEIFTLKVQLTRCGWTRLLLYTNQNEGTFHLLACPTLTSFFLNWSISYPNVFTIFQRIIWILVELQQSSTILIEVLRNSAPKSIRKKMFINVYAEAEMSSKAKRGISTDLN